MTYKKIAELAHVSVYTVSKVLSGSSEISYELSEKIRRIAMEGGYFKEKTKENVNTPITGRYLLRLLCLKL